MAEFRISNEAKADLIRIYMFEVQHFGMHQAGNYYDTFFEHFERIAENPFAVEAVDYLKKG